jgi:hypothetical protein
MNQQGEEMSQKQLHQQRSILQMNIENEKDYYESDSSIDQEDPTPKWNIPIWKGNDKQDKCDGCVTRTMSDGYQIGCEKCDECSDLPELHTSKCEGCVAQFTCDGESRGCQECDLCWDMPGLVITEDENYCDESYEEPDTTHLAEQIYSATETVENDNKIYCHGCYLLDIGIGGENQMSHACLGY